MKELAYELATRTLFIGLRAGFSPKEVEELRRRAVWDSTQKAAHTKKETPRGRHAKKLYDDIVKEHPEFTDEEIVEEIPNRWLLKGVACFKPPWLRKLVRRWRPENDAPPRPTRRRKFPLKRFRRF